MKIKGTTATFWGTTAALSVIAGPVAAVIGGIRAVSKSKLGGRPVIPAVTSGVGYGTFRAGPGQLPGNHLGTDGLVQAMHKNKHKRR